jgi:co-chaperonin GroES (HSP10)
MIVYEPIIKNKNRGIIYTNEIANADTTMLGCVKFLPQHITDISIDDIIIFSRFTSKKIIIDEKEYRMIEKRWVLGTIK